MNFNNKITGLNIVEAYRRDLLNHPVLRNLFLELTTRCNEHCLHCGSSCNDMILKELTLLQYQKFLTEIKNDFGTNSFMLCITGGEPLLRNDFFDIVSYANSLGFKWGMTSNGTLIDDHVAVKLQQSGMSTISISLDGMPDTHNALRQMPNAWERAINGIMCLRKVEGFFNVQVTTVVTHNSLYQLDALHELMCDLGIDSWRIINIEPVGRAKFNTDLTLTNEEYCHLFRYIRKLRQNGETVSYGCSHYLGIEFENEIRDWYFLCGAGTSVASIMANGDITSCLDIERRPEFIQGNILVDKFKDIWNNKFQVFRRNLSDNCKRCQNCEHMRFCHGDSFHSWDFDNNCPLLCFKDVLF